MSEVERDPALPRPPKQADNLLAWLCSHQEGTTVDLDEWKHGAIAGCPNNEAFRMVVRGLQTDGLVEAPNEGRQLSVRVTMAGWRRMEDGAARGPANVIEQSERLATSPRSSRSEAIDDAQQRDVFLCHASDDKAGVLEPLRTELDRERITYWYDAAEIKWGDSLTAKVNEGLRISRFVIVVLSRNFLGRNWPERELYAALNIEASSGRVKILPLLCGSREDRAQILERYPLLNDKSYLVFDDGVEKVIEALKARIGRTER
jgi:hypothetical protein